MRLNSIIIVLLCIGIVGCNSKNRPAPPDKLIEKDKMAEILYDVFVVSSAKGVNRKVMELNGLVPETYVLEKHNIDSLQFAESNAYYAHDIEDYQSILDKVKAKVNVEKERYGELLKKEEADKKKKSDSLRQVQKQKNKGKLVPRKFEKFKDSTSN